MWVYHKNFFNPKKEVSVIWNPSTSALLLTSLRLYGKISLSLAVTVFLFVSTSTRISRLTFKTRENKSCCHHQAPERVIWLHQWTCNFSRDLFDNSHIYHPSVALQVLQLVEIIMSTFIQMFPSGGKAHTYTESILAHLCDWWVNRFYFHAVGYIPSLTQIISLISCFPSHRINFVDHKGDLDTAIGIAEGNAEPEHDKQVYHTLMLKRNTLLSTAGKECPTLQEVPRPTLHPGLWLSSCMWHCPNTE